jgi:hypothetical protein
MEIEEITPDDSVAPVYLIPPTEEEIAELEQWAAESEARLAAEELRVAARASALDKLAKLGLTEDEAKAVIGL